MKFTENGQTVTGGRVPPLPTTKQQDNDPEERYGLVTSDRRPKPALAVVTSLFGSAHSRTRARIFGTTVLTLLVLTTLAAWVWGRRRVSHYRSLGAHEGSQLPCGRH